MKLIVIILLLFVGDYVKDIEFRVELLSDIRLVLKKKRLLFFVCCGSVEIKICLVLFCRLL